MTVLPVFNKPLFDEPCNGCGKCCYTETCEIGKVVFGDARSPCSALEFDGTRFRCGIVLHADKYIPGLDEPFKAQVFQELTSQMLGIGKGCCSDD